MPTSLSDTLSETSRQPLSQAENPAAKYAALNLEMETWAPQQILAWAIKEFGPQLAFATAFGVEGCILLSMMSQIPGYDSAYLFNLDTGYQFNETLELRDNLRQRYGLTVQFVRSEESVDHMEARFGGALYDKDPDQCCQIRKVVPLSHALKGYGAWISSIRREQSENRAKSRIIEWDKKFKLVKISPLANWTRKDVWNYVFQNNVPYNPLHDQGFTSIGCFPCTRAIRPGEENDERAGRWSGRAKTECGIHVQAA